MSKSKGRIARKRAEWKALRNAACQSATEKAERGAQLRDEDGEPQGARKKKRRPTRRSRRGRTRKPGSCIGTGKNARKSPRRETGDERLENQMLRNTRPSERPTFRMFAPKVAAEGAELRELKAQKRKARIKSERKGLKGPNRYIGTKCI